MSSQSSFCISLALFCLASISTKTHADILINEIDLIGNTVELINDGGSSIDMSTWWWCNRVNGSPFYSQVTASTVNATLSSPGATIANFGAGQTLVLDLIAGVLPDANGELGLYTTNNFSSSTAIEDYVAYGGNGIRDLPASQAGLWPLDEFIDISGIGTGETLQAFPGTTGIGPAQWLIGASTLGSTNLDPPPLPGDANNDGMVNLLDLDILGTNFGLMPADFSDGDFNDDDKVDLLDLDILGANFGAGTSASIPEPVAASLALWGLAFVALRRSAYFE